MLFGESLVGRNVEICHLFDIWNDPNQIHEVKNYVIWRWKAVKDCSVSGGIFAAFHQTAWLQRQKGLYHDFSIVFLKSPLKVLNIF